MTTLYSYSSMPMVSLLNAMNDCAAVLQSQKTFAMLYAPNWVKFGLLNNNLIPCDANNEPINLDPVYEARIFNLDVELRWLNEVGGEGQAVLLSETERTIANYDACNTIQVIKTIKQPYLLWGQVAKIMPSSGWSRLTTARIGQLDVPFSDVNLKNRVQLVALEYLAVYEEPGEKELPVEKRLSRHGNVVVAEERLTAFRVASDEEEING